MRMRNIISSIQQAELHARAASRSEIHLRDAVPDGKEGDLQFFDTGLEDIRNYEL